MANEGRRIIEPRSAPGTAPRPGRDDTLLDQAIWYLDRLIGTVVPDGAWVEAVLPALGEGGHAELAAILREATGYPFSDEGPRAFCASVDAYLAEPDGPPSAAPQAAALPDSGDPAARADPAILALLDPVAPAAGAEPAPPRADKATARASRMRALHAVDRAIFQAFQRHNAGRELSEPLAAQEARVARIFGLSPEDISILSFFYTLLERQELARCLDALPLSVFHACMAAAVGIAPADLKKLLGQGGRLVGMGFVRPDFMPPPHYALGNEIIDLYRDPESSPDYARPIEDYARESGCQLFPLDSYPVAPIARTLFGAFLAGGSGHLLVHGEPGTGKSSFVASAVKESGRPAFVLRLVGDPHEQSPDYIKLRLAAFLCAGSGAVLVVDEADSILNTASIRPGEAVVSKAWLTEFMDGAGIPVVWIANDIEGVHEAARRRFVYSLRFKSQTDAQRGRLWRRLAADSETGRRLADEDLDRLSREFRVNASGISMALRGLDQASRSGELRGEPELRLLSELLSRYQALVHGESPASRERDGAPARFVPGAIRTDVPLSAVLAGLRGAAERVRSRTELEAAGAAAPAEMLEGSEAKLLFYGPPGTGKTAYARYLAAELDLPLLQRRASDLLSTYVGQTEKAIAGLFEEAEERGAVLFLDEVDSLLRDRRMAREGWERSQVNELLSRMEDYRGILVCCTNFLEGLDPAVLRRFHWKVSFQPPGQAERLALYRRYFEELAGPLSAEDERRVAALDGLCPGDMAAVHRGVAGFGGGPRIARDLPAGGRGDPETISHAELAAMLEAELRIRSAGRRRAIGFAS